MAENLQKDADLEKRERQNQSRSSWLYNFTPPRGFVVTKLNAIVVKDAAWRRLAKKLPVIGKRL